MPDILPVEQVRRRLDVFRCDPYHAVLTAQTCLARQGRCALGKDTEMTRRGYEGGDYTRCTPDCPLGAAVRAQVPPASMGAMGQAQAQTVARNLPPVAYSRAFLSKQRVKNAVDPDALLAPAGPVAQTDPQTPKRPAKMGRKRMGSAIAKSPEKDRA